MNQDPKSHPRPEDETATAGTEPSEPVAPAADGEVAPDDDPSAGVRDAGTAVDSNASTDAAGTSGSAGPDVAGTSDSVSADAAQSSGGAVAGDGAGVSGSTAAGDGVGSSGGAAADGAAQPQGSAPVDDAADVSSEAAPAGGSAPDSADVRTDAPEEQTPEPEDARRDDTAGLLPPVADETEPAEEEHERPGRFRAWGHSPAAVLVGVLLGLLGFALAVQVRSNTSTSGLPAARQEDLVRILDDLSSREERLRRQIADLEAARTRLSTTGDRSSTALEEARTRSTALGILAGTVPAQGPGIELVLTDPERRFAAEDLLDAIEELRAAGAEAIQIGGVRVGLDTAFVGTDRGIAVDGVSLAAPYTILAIGEPATLATAMEIPGGVSDTAGRAGGDARIEQRETVVIRALRVQRTPRYAEPAN